MKFQSGKNKKHSSLFKKIQLKYSICFSLKFLNEQWNFIYLLSLLILNCICSPMITILLFQGPYSSSEDDEGLPRNKLPLSSSMHRTSCSLSPPPPSALPKRLVCCISFRNGLFIYKRTCSKALKQST